MNRHAFKCDRCKKSHRGSSPVVVEFWVGVLVAPVELCKSCAELSWHNLAPGVDMKARVEMRSK